MGDYFANGSEGDAWTSVWCDTCTHDHDQHHGSSAPDVGGCPLFLAALVGEIVPEWSVREGAPFVLPPDVVGSGTTGVGALMEGRRFLGVEKMASYAEIARRRMAAVEAAPTLFAETFTADALDLDFPEPPEAEEDAPELDDHPPSRIDP